MEQIDDMLLQICGNNHIMKYRGFNSILRQCRLYYAIYLTSNFIIPKQ